MKYLRRLCSYLPLVGAAIVLAALFSVSAHPSRLPYAVAAIGAVVLLTGGTLGLQALFRNRAIAPAALPGFLVASMTFADFFVEDTALRLAIAAAVSILFLVLIRHISESTRLEGATVALRALSEWSAIIIIVGSSAGLLAAVTFLNWNVYLAALAFAAIVVFITFTMARLSAVSGYFLPAAVSLLIIQGFVLLAYLPVSHWVGAGVLSALAYLLYSLITSAPVISVRRTLISAGIMCGLLLGTARWR